MVTKLLMPLVIFALTTVHIHSQVSNIKKNIREDKSSESNSQSNKGSSSSNSSTKSSSSSSFDIGDFEFADEFLVTVFQILGYPIIIAQEAALSQGNYECPHLTSLESTLDIGTSFSKLTLQPSIKGNWGIIGTDFRYSLLHDKTGSLESYDWQVLVFRAPIKVVTLHYGIGYTYVFDPEKFYPECSTGLNLSLHQQKINVMGSYRWTLRDTKKRYRQEVKFTADYQWYRKGIFMVSPLVGITYQNYFYDDEFIMINIGIKLRLT